jgi:hypothetical protein
MGHGHMWLVLSTSLDTQVTVLTNCTLTCECLGYACEWNKIEYCTFEYNVS